MLVVFYFVFIRIVHGKVIQYLYYDLEYFFFFTRKFNPKETIIGIFLSRQNV